MRKADDTTPDEAPGLGSPYDPDPGAEADLWFLPGDPEEDGLLPGGPPARRSLMAPGDWLRAEAAQAAGLARAAAEIARLDQMVEHLGAGAVTRLALVETEAMAWTEGARLRREEIGRDLMARATDPGAHGDLARARWAMRRLGQRPGALPALRGFLGLHETETPETLPDDLRQRPVGGDFAAAAADFGDGLAAMEAAHPLTRAIFAYRLWQLAGLSAPGAVTEPATAAARIAAAENRFLGFAPCAAVRQIWLAGGSAEDRFARWIAAFRQGALTAMMDLRRLDDWAVRARAATGTMKGGSPRRVVDALVARPLLSTEDAALATGISRDSAERILARLHAGGIVREITGQSRFRLWSAAV